MVRAVVVDFDGVLADSMGLHAEAYRQVLAPWGVRFEDQAIFDLEGARSETIVRDLLVANGHAPSDEEVARLADQKQVAFATLGPAALYAGAEAMLGALRQRADKLALVTGTRKENLERLIPHLLPQFDAVLAQEDYTRDKPDPEPYAKAAQRISVPPADCVGLENAVRGVQSARAAGYGRVVGLTTTMSSEALLRAGAHVVAADHAEVADLVGPSSP